MIGMNKSLISKVKSSTSSKGMLMSTLQATEQFAMNFKTSPIPSRLNETVKQSTLKNGVRVITKGHDSISGPVSVKFAVLGGSRSESLSEKGSAHLLASSAFAGTSKRSGLRLTRDLENIGAKISSSSDREKITYDVSVSSDKLEEAIKAVAEAIVYPPNDSYIINEQKPTANISYKLCPKSQLKELLHEAAYGEATPLGASMYASNLDDLDADDVLLYRKTNFTSGNIVVSASGVPHDSFSQLLECYLHGLPAGPSPLPASPYIGGDIRMKANLDASYVAIGFPVPAGDASLPYDVLFGNLQLAVSALHLPKGSVTPFYSKYTSGGLIGYYIQGKGTQAAAHLEAGLSELKKIAKGTVNDAAMVQTALTNIIAIDSENKTESLLNSVLTGVKSIDTRSVTSSNVSAAAAAALKSTPSYAILGSAVGIPSFSSVVTMLAK